MKRLWETGLLLFAVAGFWGMVYPDLCFVSDVCRVKEVQMDDGGLAAPGDGESMSGEKMAAQTLETPTEIGRASCRERV